MQAIYMYGKWLLISFSILGVFYIIRWVMTDENGEMGKNSSLYGQSLGGRYNILIYIIPIIVIIILLLIL